ncbi:MAG TPA: hypothetical protein VLE48_14125, partial [Terriglobales bacterium]|nr:hypothetical protein [Terriglobales bacterium]
VLSEFRKRVDDYVKLRKRVDDSVPPLKPKRTAEQIAEHEQALAGKLRQARAGAKRGDIFTPEISAQFALLIRREFRGPEAPAAIRTIRQGDPVSSISLRVNQTYPDTLPVTTMPPTLLLKLPELPKEVAYRIVGRDFVLVDMTTNVVVDFIPEVMPPMRG